MTLNTFSIIRHRGQLNEGETSFGLKVYRKTSLFVPEQGRFIPCAPYEEHFIFEVPAHYKDMPSYQCTCGSAAVIAGMSSYEHEGSSPQGLMFVCLNHATFGLHATGKDRWI